MENNSNPIQKQDILGAFKREFSSTYHPIFINSKKQEFHFRDITVVEQKTLSKITLEYENRKDVIYDTQCQLINKLAVEDGFDVYDLCEFDRIRILMEIYQDNYMKSSISYKCEECGCDNIYTLDFNTIIERFNSFDLEDKILELDDKDRKYTFTINFPSVRNVSNFFKDYMKKYKNVSESERNALDSLSNVDYVNLYIKKIRLENKKSGDVNELDMTALSLADIEELFSMFPQNIMFSQDNGVIKFITTNFIDKVNDIFKYEKCKQCGAETEEGIGSLIDFF